MPLNPIDGTDESEPLPGTIAADHIRGFGGNDTVTGEGGNDSIEGGSGHDHLYGGDGRDTIRGGDGDDRIEGAAGNDRLYGDAGNDSFGIGFFGGAGTWRVFGGADDDRMAVFDRVSGHFDGGTGDDRFQLFWYQSPEAVSGSLASGFASGAYNFSLAGVERLSITTGSADDTITGGNGRDEIAVLAGANVVDASGGNDLVTYHAGLANTLDGGAGNDMLRTGLPYNGAPARFTFDASGPVVTDGLGSTIVGFERYWVAGSYYNDTLTGGAGRDRLQGITGHDVLSGMGGDDHLAGGSGDDRLSGGAGNDRLHGGSGYDTLEGGDGADTFVFRRPDGEFDVIADFSGAEGDHLVVPGGWYGLPAGAPVTLSLDAALGTTRQFVYDTVAGLLIYDADGTGGVAAVQVAVLTGAPTLTAFDIEVI